MNSIPPIPPLGTVAVGVGWSVGMPVDVGTAVVVGTAVPGAMVAVLAGGWVAVGAGAPESPSSPHPADMSSSTAWSATVENTQSIVMGGTTVFVGGKDELAAFNSADGTPLWSVVVDGDVYSMAIAGGRLFASTSKGKVYCYE